MLKLLGLIIKTAVFTLIVLVVANIVKIGNKTVSDQVKTEMAHADRTEIAGKVRTLAESLATHITQDARVGFKNQLRHAHLGGPEGETGEKIPSSERQKLRDLMREFNSPTNGN